MRTFKYNLVSSIKRTNSEDLASSKDFCPYNKIKQLASYSSVEFWRLRKIDDEKPARELCDDRRGSVHNPFFGALRLQTQGNMNRYTAWGFHYSGKLTHRKRKTNVLLHTTVQVRFQGHKEVYLSRHGLQR